MYMTHKQKKHESWPCWVNGRVKFTAGLCFPNAASKKQERNKTLLKNEQLITKI